MSWKARLTFFIVTVLVAAVVIRLSPFELATKATLPQPTDEERLEALFSKWTLYMYRAQVRKIDGGVGPDVSGDYWVRWDRSTELLPPEKYKDTVSKLFAPVQPPPATVVIAPAPTPALPAVPELVSLERLQALKAPPVAEEEEELTRELLVKSYGSVDARLIRVHDGDTIVVDIPLWPAIVGEAIQVRLHGYDAPELQSEKHGALAKQATERMTELTATQRVRLMDLRRDKFFRLNARILSEGVDVATKLVAEGLVKPYTGRGPKPWSE